MMDVKEQNVVPRTFMHHLSARNTRYYFWALLKMSLSDRDALRAERMMGDPFTHTVACQGDGCPF